MRLSSKAVMIGLLSAAMMLAACNSQDSGGGSKFGGDVPQRSNDELLNDTQSLNGEESQLETIGLKITASYESHNGVSTTTFRWDQALLSEHQKSHPEFKVSQYIEALERYVARAEAYLVKYERSKNDGNTYTAAKLKLNDIIEELKAGVKALEEMAAYVEKMHI